MISIVSPFYNERSIIKDSLNLMLKNLSSLDEEWEFIVVNDGSTDNSLKIVEEIARNEKRLNVVSYDINKGRGYAIRQGIAEARGDIIITTEIDSSWGDDIVERIVQKMRENKNLDILVASPHLKGGGYRNVPLKRVLLSKLGNFLIKNLFTSKLTMNTGMTRGYRSEVIKTMPLDEDGKEIHLEILVKALSFKFNIAEIPTILEWKIHKLEYKSGKRKSSTKIREIITSHLVFSVFANPIRYFWFISGLLILLSFVSLTFGLIRFFMGSVSIFLAILSLLFLILGGLSFAFGIITEQLRANHKEMWRIQRALKEKDYEKHS